MISLASAANLDGTVGDDGLPNPPGALTTTWSKQSGPGTVTFGNANAVDTTTSFSVAGTYVLRLTADDSALSNSDDVTITVNPGTASALVFTTQPENTTAGSSITGPPTVTVIDSLGNTVNLLYSIHHSCYRNNPGGGTLSGTTPENAVSGVASFTDLSINQSGTGYTLTASSAGLTGTTSTSPEISAKKTQCSLRNALVIS